MPWDSTMVFIGLNTVFFSNRYYNACNPSDTTNPAQDEFAWLEQTLADCKTKGQQVWLSYHIPPGMDIYKSGKTHPCGAVTMWHERHNAAFIALVNKYSDIVKGNFAGHTHVDEFRLMDDGKKVTSFVHITPAMSPIFNNNPAFTELTWNPAKMELLNSVTYRFGGIQTPSSNTWTEEYNYGKTYGISSINANSLDTLWQKMDTDPTLHADYAKYYYVNNPNKSPNPWKTYWCGARYMDTAEFVRCNCK